MSQIQLELLNTLQYILNKYAPHLTIKQAIEQQRQHQQQQDAASNKST